MAPDVPAATIIKTVALTEIGYGSVVTSASWEWENANALLSVRIEPSHGGFDPYNLVIVPGDIGEYEIRRE